MPRPLLKPTYEKMPLSVSHANPALTPFLLAEGLSSMETLLTNIQVTTQRQYQMSSCSEDIWMSGHRL